MYFFTFLTVINYYNNYRSKFTKDYLPSITSVAAKLYFVVYVTVVTGIENPVVPTWIGTVFLNGERWPLSTRLIQVTRHTRLSDVSIVWIVAYLD